MVRNKISRRRESGLMDKIWTGGNAMQHGEDVCHHHDRYELRAQRPITLRLLSIAVHVMDRIHVAGALKVGTTRKRSRCFREAMAAHRLAWKNR